MDEEQIKIEARKTLEKKRVSQIPDDELARGCESVIQDTSRTSLKKALVLAHRFVAISRGKNRNFHLTSTRALARMSHMSGRHRDALKAYQAARALASDQRLVRGRIDRALADVHLYLGNTSEAVKAARRAISAFRSLHSDNDLAQAEVNYANILHRLDRHRDAEKIYRKAEEFFESSGNLIAAARCHYNRANTLLQLFEVDEAEELYRKAEKIYTESEFDLDACDARYGLAWLWMLTGRFHQALLELSACEKIYHDGGDPRGEALCRLDRAEVYLGLGLYHDALTMASLAEQNFSKLKLRYERTKASLFRSQAAAKLGKEQVARVAAGRARREFEKEKNRGFLGVTYLVKAELAQGSRQFRRQHQYLTHARKHFSYAQLPLWEAICDLRLSFHESFTSSAFARLRKNPAIEEVPHLAVAWKSRQGELKFARGDITGARRLWEEAAEQLDILRAQLPPLDLRSALIRQLNAPHQRLVEINLQDNPLEAAVWAERYRTAGVWAPLNESADSLAPDDKINRDLGALSRQIAAVAYQIDAGSGRRSIPASARNAALNRMRARVRESLLEYEPKCAAFPVSREILASDFQKVSRNLPILQFHLQQNDIIAFHHRREGLETVRILDGRSRLSDMMRRWRFLLESELLASDRHIRINHSAEHSLWLDMGEMLWKPLEIDDDIERILIIPEGELSNIPWMALRVDGNYLSERYSFLVAPSLRHHRKAYLTHSDSTGIAIFHGLSDKIPRVAEELNQLTSLTSPHSSLIAECRRQDLIAAPEADIWHYSGHAQFCSDNPFYSYLAMHDGPLFAADLRAKICRVNLVTLAGCRSGEQLMLPGEEATGLVRSLLEMGARNIIAALWPLSDESSSFWMISFYNKLMESRSITEACRYAAATVREQYPSAYHWAAFSIFGAGDLGGNYEN